MEMDVHLARETRRPAESLGDLLIKSKDQAEVGLLSKCAKSLQIIFRPCQFDLFGVFECFWTITSHLSQRTKEMNGLKESIKALRNTIFLYKKRGFQQSKSIQALDYAAGGDPDEVPSDSLSKQRPLDGSFLPWLPLTRPRFKWLLRLSTAPRATQRFRVGTVIGKV